MNDHNRKALWVPAACLALFLAATACKINGSSAAIWSAILHDKGTWDSLLFSTPKAVRSDEWLVWTPAILAQVNHVPPFPVENASLGAGKSPLLMSLPVRHYSMFFRPQLYGFFFLGPERAFAWYWNTKIFGLIAAMFLLLRKLTDNDTLLALAGSLWVFLSGFVQWWFSCPPMLPEMLACWALALVCVMTLITPQKPLAKWASALGLIISAVDFALCMYPPFQIPLVYLGALILACWIWERRNKKLPLQADRGSLAALFIAAAVIAGVVGAFLIECKPTIAMVAATSYPGARRTFGGAMEVNHLFLGLAGPFESEKAFPEKFSNVCEAAGFYPMWIVAALAGAWAFRGKWRENPLPLGLLIYLLGAAAFCVHRLPEWLCGATLWSFTTEDRVTLAIGLANIFLTIVVLHRLRNAMPALGAKIGVALLSGAVMAGALLAAARESPGFFSAGTLASCIVVALLLAAIFLWAQPGIFILALLCALAPAGLLVNPVMTGLAPLTQAAPLDAIRELRNADPGARWVVYDSSHLSAFLMSAGVPVLSGAKTVPDLAFYKLIDPSGAFANIYNRYSIVMFEMPPRRETVGIELVNFCSHRNYIHPTNPALRAMNVRYFVYKQALADPAAEGLKLARALPESGIWIYRLE